MEFKTNEPPLTVDEFISGSVKEARPILTELRKMIMTSFPGIEEKIGYGVPQYRSENISLGMSAAKGHVTIGFHLGAISDDVRKQLEGKGYRLGLQTLQIGFEQDIPKGEIREIFNGIKELDLWILLLFIEELHNRTTHYQNCSEPFSMI